MRGVLDLSGIKGYRYLAGTGAIFAFVSILGLLLTILAEFRHTAIYALLCSALAYAELFLLRLLSAEIQRLDSGFWVRIDHYVFKWMFRVTTVLNSIAIGFSLSGNHLLAAYAQYIISVCWFFILSSNIVLIVICMRSWRRNKIFTSRILAAAERDGMKRFQTSIANYLSRTQANPHPMIRHVGVCSIPQMPFYDVTDFPFLRILESEYQTIRRELEDIFQNGKGFRPYAYGSVGGAGWETFHFHKGRQRILENSQRCPETTRIIESIPDFHLRHPVFSLLRPGASAAPHRDYSNVTLNCHLGVIVPQGNCAIRVGAEIRHWEEGQCLIFDTSYEHEVWNFSRHPRVVLQVTFYRPELTTAEKMWWNKMFYGHADA